MLGHFSDSLLQTPSRCWSRLAFSEQWQQCQHYARIHVVMASIGARRALGGGCVWRQQARRHKRCLLDIVLSAQSYSLRPCQYLSKSPLVPSEVTLAFNPH